MADRRFTVAHLRRVHYKILSTGAQRYDFSLYENIEGCWSELCYAARYAQYLGLVDAEAIEYKRNAPAVVNCEARKYETYPFAALGSEWREDLAIGSVKLADVALDLHLPVPFAVGYTYEHADKVVLLEVWVEKSTMDDILSPLCAGLGINLVTGKSH